MEDTRVSFRLPAPYGRRLQREAKERGISPHQYARLLLIREMENAAVLDLRDEMRRFGKRLEEIADGLRKKAPEGASELALRLSR